MPTRCPTLTELPPPLPGRTGWPWTEETKQLASTMPNGSPWPRISIVTPSYNQGPFIEETIRSVLLQGYPNLEYFVLDGGSSDNSVEVIKQYSSWINYWISEPDRGQSEAINRGLDMGSGLFATWINSDDMLCKNALVEHASGIGFDPNVVYVGDCIYIDVARKFLFTRRGRIHSLEDLLCIRTVWRSAGNIVQPEVLFPLKLVREVGGLNADNHRTMDYELWGKLFLAGARFQYTEIPFGMFRRHHGQKTIDGLRTTQSLIDTALKLLDLADSFSQEARGAILVDLHAYLGEYEKRFGNQIGRLDRMGLPAPVVTQARHLRIKLRNTVNAFFRAIGES